jgi:hypothetical protein
MHGEASLSEREPISRRRGGVSFLCAQIADRLQSHNLFSKTSVPSVSSVVSMFVRHAQLRRAGEREPARLLWRNRVPAAMIWLDD